MITLSGNVPLTTLPAPTTTFFPNVVPFNMLQGSSPPLSRRGAFSEDQAVPQGNAHYRVRGGNRCL